MRHLAPPQNQNKFNCSCDEFAGTTGSLDAGFCVLGELLGSNETNTLGEFALSENLEIAL